MPPYIVLHTTLPQTIAIGVYDNKREAYEQYLRFIEDRFPNLLIQLETYYEMNYPDENLLDLLMDPHMDDEIQDIMSFTVLESVEDFDGTEYDNWDPDSLGRLEEMLDNEGFGDTWY